MNGKYCLLLFFAALAWTSEAQDKPVAFKGALIYPIVGAPIQNGVIIVQKGKIVKIGGADTAIPADAVVNNVSGKVIMPGLIDTHSHLGGPAGGDASAPIHPDARVLDDISPASDGFMKALAGGLTTLNVMPGSGHLMSGQTIYVKMREGKIIEDILIVNERGVFGGMKMANGTNPLRANSANGYPGTRAKSAALAREIFVKAQEYRKKVIRAGKDSTKMPDRDLKMEALMEVLSGKRVVHFHTHKENDILTAIRLSKEFGFRLVLQHVSEAWKVADEIAKAKVPASIITIDSPGGKLEAMNFSFNNGIALEKAGAAFGFHTDDGITDSRFFLRSAALMVKQGLSREKAMEALTLAGAKMMDMSSRVGSLEAGKDADLIVLSGDPFSVYTKVEQTWVEGKKRFDLSNPADKAFAVGGYHVYMPERGEFHHHEGDTDEQ